MLPDEIWITGRMGVGKDTVGARLVRELGYTRLALADALKREVAERHGITVAELEAHKARYRTELQEVGHGRRQTIPDYWIDRWCESRAGITGPVVCTDMRYVNEAHAALGRGALLVRVWVPEDVRRARLERLYGAVTEAQLHHPSESAIDGLPVHLELRGDLPLERITTELVAAYLASLDDFTRTQVLSDFAGSTLARIAALTP